MPSSPSFLNQVASGFNKKLGSQPSSNSGASNDGAGDSDTASAHKAVNDELSGQICPDCHSVVKGALVTAFGEPANEAHGFEGTKEEADKMNLNMVPPKDPLAALRNPNGVDSR